MLPSNLYSQVTSFSYDSALEMNLIHEELRRAHEDGRTVFFCGAGVSVPAGLPSFKKLVENVLSDFLPSKESCSPGSTEALAWKAFDDDRYDAALDILESPREGGHEPKDVRKSVKSELTEPKTRTLDKHLLLAKLADLDTNIGKLVTTNFDPLFERATLKLRRKENSTYRTPAHIAPTLPPAKPGTLNGLVYLHGKLESSDDDRGLVLTLADFGTAYLLEGWARRFVVELFRHYHVVFVGYSVEDPTMRYLIAALAAAREESLQFQNAYVFAPYGEEDHLPENKEDAEQEWKLKGITPLPYSSADHHAELWQALEEWADDHRQGIMGRRQKVARLSKSPPLDDEDPAIKEMLWALEDPVVAKYFANLDGDDLPDAGWIAPLQKAGLLSWPRDHSSTNDETSAPLVSRILPDCCLQHDVTIQLRRWIAGSIGTKEALEWAINGGCVVQRDLRWEIRNSLRDSSNEISPALRKIWQVLADDNYAHALSSKNSGALVRAPKLAPDNLFAVRTFLNRLRPIPVFNLRFPLIDEERLTQAEKPSDWCKIDICLVGVSEDYEVESVRDRSTDWQGSLALLADDLTSCLKEAMDWLAEFELASPSTDLTHIGFRSISPHEQNKYAEVWTQLIALTRESYDALVDTGDQTGAERLRRRWQSLPYPIFRRLALYASTGSQDA